MADLLYKDEVYATVGAAMEVYNDLGPGFLENVYQEAMEIETSERKIPSKPQQEVHIKFKNKLLKRFYLADLVCYGRIIVELKAMDTLTLREEGQLLNYLKATGMKVGLLINFGHFPSLDWKRLVLTKDSTTHTLREDETIYSSTISED